MSVRLDGNIIALEGQCRVEDAELLLGLLQGGTGRIVDLTEAEHLHAAVLQILMALRPTLRGVGKNAFMGDWITPALMASCTIDMGSQEG
jgi:hypothetical protein